MSLAQQAAKVIPFPEDPQLRPDPERREQLRRNLEREFLERLDGFDDITLYHLDQIDAAFLADKREVDGFDRYTRLYSTLPTPQIEGSHELKIVGGETVSFFIFEINEPRVVRQERTSPELARMSRQRVNALEGFSQLEPDAVDAGDVLRLLSNLAFHRDPFQRAGYFRWVGATPAESPDRPAIMTTLQLEVGADITRIEHGMHPYSPNSRYYEARTDELLHQQGGEKLIYHITEAFLEGRGNEVHTWFSTDRRITQFAEKPLDPEPLSGRVMQGPSLRSLRHSA